MTRHLSHLERGLNCSVVRRFPSIAQNTLRVSCHVCSAHGDEQGVFHVQHFRAKVWNITYILATGGVVSATY